MGELLVGAIIIFLGGVVQGCAGFGLSLSTVPVMVLFIQPLTLTPVQTIISLVNNFTVLAGVWRRAAWQQVVWLVVGGVCGIPVGIYLLKSLDSSWIKAGIGIVVLVVAIVMFAGWALKLPPRLAALIPVGVLSGILGGSTSLNGPPVILYFASQRPEKDVFRANMAMYFTAVNLVATVMFLCGGLLTARVLIMVLVFLVPLIAGTLCGIWMAGQISEQRFRHAVLILLALIGIMLISSNLPAILG